MNAPTQRKNFLIALLIGALAVPLLALAANGLIEGNGSQDQADEPEVASLSPLLTESIEKVVDTDRQVDEPTEDYLAAACGSDGMALVDKETDGSIDAIEQAALDALRPICDEAGLTLPDAAEVAPVVQKVVVVEQAPAPAPATSVDDGGAESGSDDGYESKDHEDEKHEEDEEDEEDDH
ncbi:MAG: hypothetical protein P1T08_05695 [Acidimicrobiia bacterium]|nr:hypothetical protein [Acidimicrobiia bacterium]